MLIRCPRARRWPEGGGKEVMVGVGWPAGRQACGLENETGVKKEVIPIVADPCIFRNRSVE